MPKKIQIDDGVLTRLEAQRPTYLSPTAFVNQLVDQALTMCNDTRVPIPEEPCTREESKLSDEKVEASPVPEDGCSLEEPLLIQKRIKAHVKKIVDPFRLRALDPDLVPDDLKHCSDLLVDFWSVKKGTRSERAATRLFEKLRTMGADEQKEALAAAYDAQWATVYTPKPDNPQQNKWNPEPVNNHPAARVFTAKDFYGEPEPNNPIDLLF